MTDKKILDITDIKKLIPHRYPMLLVDKMIDYVAGESGVGVKCVTGNEAFFEGHFPAKPVMPGVMIIEALAQTGAIVTALNMEDVKDKIVFFMSIDNAKFRRPVVPGDVLQLRVKNTKAKGKILCYHGEAWVENQLAAEADLMAMITDVEK